MNPDLSQERQQQIVEVVALFLERNSGYFSARGILSRVSNHSDLRGVSSWTLDQILLAHEQTKAPQIIQSREPRGSGFEHSWKYAGGWKPTWPSDQERIDNVTRGHQPDPFASTRHSFFISYSSADLDIALALRTALNARGYGGFIAHVENTDDMDAIEFVGRYLPTHDYYAACLSMNAIKSDWVLQELQVVRDQYKKPFLTVLSGRDEAFLEILANVDECQLNRTVDQNELLRLLSFRQSKENRKWARSTLIPFLLGVKEQTKKAEATLCWPPTKKLAATLVHTLHIKSFDEALACFCVPVVPSNNSSLPLKPDDLQKKRRRKKAKRRKPFKGLLSLRSKPS